MPFRDFYAQRGARHPVAYSRITLVAGMLALMAITLATGLKLYDQSMKEGQARQRAAVCAVADRMVQVYQGPDLTPVGREVGKAWRELRATFNCNGGT